MHLHIRECDNETALRVIGEEIDLDGAYVVTGEDLGECEAAIVNVKNGELYFSDPPTQAYNASWLTMQDVVSAVKALVELDDLFNKMHA